jgi:glycosyltransferase involved in cell wall biosynthesis
MLLSNIISKCNRVKNRTLNIITASTHERYESGLAKTNHNFYAVRGEHIKNWHTKYAPIPQNYTILDGNGFDQIPRYIDFDLVLSQNQFGQFPVLQHISKALQIPLVTLCHTMPYDGWDTDEIKESLAKSFGDVNIFISEYSKNAWEKLCGKVKNANVINHMIDSNTFSYKEKSRNKTILTVANDYINRDHCLNFSQYKRVTKDLPTLPIGDTEGFSKKANSIEELVMFYNSCKVFLNTAHVSPIPMSVLEAMACGNVVVSCNTCAIPEYIEHGVNGFLADNDEEMRYILETILNTKEEDLYHIRKNAVKTIQEKCSPEKFITTWYKIFYGVANAS